MTTTDGATFPAQIVCPFCWSGSPEVKLADDGETTPPKDGDFAFCFTCGEFAVFEAGSGRLWQRRPTHDEYQMIVDTPHFTAVRRAWVKATETVARRVSSNGAQ